MTPPKQTLEVQIDSILADHVFMTMDKGKGEPLTRRAIRNLNASRLLSLIKQVTDEVIGSDEDISIDSRECDGCGEWVCNVSERNKLKIEQRQTLNDILEGRRGV